MSVRPTLLSLGIASLLPVLFALGVVADQCQAEAERVTPKAATETSQNAGPETDGARGTAQKPVQSGAAPQPGTSAKATDAKATDAKTPEKTPQADENAAKVETYRWTARRSDNKIKLRGTVPSEKDQRTVVGMAKAHFADLEIDDGMKVTEEAPSQEHWLSAVSFALNQLTHMENGNVRLSDSALSVDGKAKSAEDYAELRAALFGPLPTGLSVQKIDVTPARAEPFRFVASLNAKIVTLAGNVPNEEMHQHLKDRAAQAFRGCTINDQLVLASGEPDHWEAAAFAALAALSRLQEGEVTLSDDALNIDGTAPDKTTATELSFQLKKDLPSLFHASENIRWREAAKSRDLASSNVPNIEQTVDHPGRAMPDLGLSLENSKRP